MADKNAGLYSKSLQGSTDDERDHFRNLAMVVQRSDRCDCLDPPDSWQLVAGPQGQNRNAG